MLTGQTWQKLFHTLCNDHFKMFKIELNSHYLDFWTQIYNFLVVWVIYTNYASNVTLIFYILGLSSIFIFIFFSDCRTLKFLKM